MNQRDLKRAPSTWQNAVRKADQEAEDQWDAGQGGADFQESVSLALWSIAAELRAARIAERPSTHGT